MAIPVSFRWDEEFVGRVDEARGDVPRSAWVRRAVERALEGAHRERMALESARAVVAQPENYPAWAVETAEQALGGSVSAAPAKRVQDPPAPAEQPLSDYVCPQCGPAPEGPDEHAERFHTWAVQDQQPRVRSSSEARPFRPVPKKGER